MPEKLRTLAEFTLPHMILTCSHCGRRGRYNVARLIEAHGADLPIRDFINTIGRSCHRRRHPTKWHRCGLGCDALIYMFMPKPAADGYAEEIEHQREHIAR
ncbi:hypothetical protein [Sinorhizobium americanum]|uniref:Uncharacterized protein n=1 Tax=Sinorhizobium americanum TaxID=194963 RepID=A0A4R2BTW0_9HYPH|nr:hypothetical protein [Sinorhizobium americanum]TCN30365.1 hypothetical protein EV184_108239 [Sinorhizobium americanum]